MRDMIKVTSDKYYHALALYMIACRKQREVDNLETEMNHILGFGNGSHASDAIYTIGNIGSKEEFDEAIGKMGIEVEDKKA